MRVQAKQTNRRKKNHSNRNKEYLFHVILIHNVWLPTWFSHSNGLRLCLFIRPQLQNKHLDMHQDQEFPFIFLYSNAISILSIFALLKSKAEVHRFQLNFSRQTVFCFDENAYFSSLWHFGSQRVFPRSIWNDHPDLVTAHSQMVITI